MWGWSWEIFGSSLHQQNLEWVELWCRKENCMWLLAVFYTIFSLVYSFVSCLAFYISLRSSQNGSINSSEWKTKMSQSEDSIKERQNFSKSSSEESMFEDETMCSTHQLHSSDSLFSQYLLICSSRVTILFLNLLFSFSKVWQLTHTKSSFITSLFERFTVFTRTFWSICGNYSFEVLRELELGNAIFINVLFLWFNWACNHLSNGLKHSKSVVIVCYSERNSGH